jgi:dienelactone hydrolase
MVALLFLLALSPLEKMELVMGPRPQMPTTPPAIRVLGEEDLGNTRRQRIEYEAEPGDWVPAYLFLPKHAGPHPAMLCLHQTTKIGKAEPAGLGGNPDLHYALELARAGYVAIAPDYPNFGDYKFDAYAHGYLSATMKGIVNHQRAVDLLVSLPGVDAKRIGVVGHSLGGHNALFVAAFDQRLKAVVTSCGFTAFARYNKGDLTGWSHRGYMPRIAKVYGKDPARMPFDFADVFTAIAPRMVYVNAPLRDSNFDVEGVRETLRRSQGPFIMENPDTGHSFPAEVRNRAYALLEVTLTR